MILTNDPSSGESLENKLRELSQEADKIAVAVAFYSDAEIVKSWLAEGKNIELIVSLQPPMNYYHLRDLLPIQNVEIRFLGRDFHSKMFLFYSSGSLFATVLGSSNFTDGGLRKNIETNVLLTDRKHLSEVETHFAEVYAKSRHLQPTELKKYKKVYDKSVKPRAEIDKISDRFQRDVIDGRSSYYDFWRTIDRVRDLVERISEREYPGIPVYLTIDHFWHWVATVWDRSDVERLGRDAEYRDNRIPVLFAEYCEWDKTTQNYTESIPKNSRTIANLLAEDKIDNLTKAGAKTVYRRTHSGGMRSQWLKSHEAFVKDNSIAKIRKSLKYLLYSNDDIDLRIHNLISNHEYKLSQFGPSTVQELIGWVFPEEYPIRNDKADRAIRLLGY
jgi:HKD family nuclease